MKARKIKITEQAVEILKGELSTLEHTYNSAAIEFRNSKGETVACPINLIDRLGRYAGPAEDKASFAQYVAVYFRATHEATKGAKAGAECRLSAGSSARNGVRVTSTVKGLDPKKADVASQYATAQRIARDIHAIQTELARRANVEKIAADAAAAAKAEADTREYLGMAPVAAAA